MNIATGDGDFSIWLNRTLFKEEVQPLIDKFMATGDYDLVEVYRERFKDSTGGTLIYCVIKGNLNKKPWRKY